jgi:pimeloyl-ACP methyl ester carboxylesterase
MAAGAETVEVRGITVTLQRGGEGEPVLYLHSASAEAAAWNQAFELLAQRHSVIAPIHPGFPGSTGLQRINGVGDLVLHYVDLMNRLGLRRAHVVGSSLGGWIAAELASLYPERVGSLSLVGAAGLWIDGAPIGEVFGILPGQLAERLFHDQQHPIAQFLHAAGENAFDTPPPEDVLLAFHQSTEATARVAWNPYFHNPALEGRLDRIDAPTLVLWGAEDKLIPRAHAERYRDRIAGAELRLIPHCGHLPAIEQPEAFAREVANFLAAHPLNAGKPPTV